MTDDNKNSDKEIQDTSTNLSIKRVEIEEGDFIIAEISNGVNVMIKRDTVVEVLEKKK